MYIKQFRSRFVRVPDPLRPGRYALEERLVPTGASQVTYDGRTYESNADFWIKVPEHVGAHHCSFRTPSGARFMTDVEVGEHVRFGTADAEELPGLDEPAPVRTPRRVTRAKAAV